MMNRTENEDRTNSSLSGQLTEVILQAVRVRSLVDVHCHVVDLQMLEQLLGLYAVRAVRLGEYNDAMTLTQLSHEPLLRR